MKRYIWFLIFFLLTTLAYAEDKVSFSGSLKNETSIRIEGLNGDLTKEKNIVELASQYKIKDEELIFFIKAKYWYDAAYDSRDKLDQAQHYDGHIQRTDWLRDCYLDYTRGNWFLRLGKQQVAWGQADGIQILDRVNPVDLREFYLPDLVDIRIPLWMANINYSPKLDSNLQLLFVPDWQQSEAAYLGGSFVFRSFTEFDAFMKYMMRLTYTWDIKLNPVPRQFNNSTWGLQWSDRLGDLDYTLNFLYTHYTSARNVISLAGTRYTVNRNFPLYRIYGCSFNKTFTHPGLMQGITLRGDFAYYNDEPTYFGNPTAASTKGYKRWDNKFWLIGMDRNFLTRWTASFQFAQYILEHAKVGRTTAQEVYPMNAYTYGPMDQVENIFSLKLSSHFCNDRLKPEISWSFTDDNQGKLSPKVSYEIKDNLVFSTGIHYFYGNAWDSNGQFRDQSQFYTQLKYSF